MKTYEVTFNVNGRSGGRTAVQASSSTAAKQIALSKIQGMPGYAGKRISVTGCREIK